MPRAGILQAISIVFANMGGSGFYLPVGAVMRPFVCVGTMAANATDLAFSIITETMTYTEPYVGTGNQITKYTLRWGSLEGIHVPIAKGTAVAVILGWMGEGLTDPMYTNAAVSGSLYFI